jgi:hypothetical protein
MKKFGRMEASKEVRRVLIRHYVDMSACQYQTSGREIRLTGKLWKLDGSDFLAAHIECMIQEFQRRLPGYFVSGEMENWKFTTDHITRLGPKEEKATFFASDEEAEVA